MPLPIITQATAILTDPRARTANPTLWHLANLIILSAHGHTIPQRTRALGGAA